MQGHENPCGSDTYMWFIQIHGDRHTHTHREAFWFRAALENSYVAALVRYKIFGNIPASSTAFV